MIKEVDLLEKERLEIQRQLDSSRARIERIAQYRIPNEFLIPALPPSRYLYGDEIDTDSEGNPLVEQKLFLLSCDLPEHEVEEKYPTFWNYLQLGIEQKIDKNYLCSHRTPWYSQEKRPAPLFVYCYMGRQKAEKLSPFRFLLN